MASQYARSIRHRSLLLAWDAVLPGGRSGQRECPAKSMCWDFLRDIGHYQMPNDKYKIYRTASGHGLCFNCKRETEYLGLHFSCTSCIPPKSYRYMFTYFVSMQFAYVDWD